MAAILTQQPSGVVTIDQGLCYCLILTDIGDEIVSKELAYQVCVDGAPITEIIVEKPKDANVPIYINPVNLIEWRLRTIIPRITLDDIQTDNTFKSKVTLKYGEAIFDSEDCDNNSVSIGAQSNEVTVVNSHCQMWNDPFLPDKFPLATMPKLVTQCAGTYDWIWLCNSTISYEIIFNGGSSTVNSYTATEAQYVAVGSGNIDLGGGLPGLNDRENIRCIKIYGSNAEGANQLLSTVQIIPCCCDDDCRVDLYFLDPKGSWRAVGGFKCTDSRSTEFDGTVICKEMPCNVSYDVALREYGNTFLRKRGFTKVTFKGKFCINCDNREFYEAFGGSGHYLIRVGNLLTRFIATTRDVPNYKDNDLTEITFTGYYNHEYRGHMIS